MKKRIVLLVLFSISLLLITGCRKKDYVEENDTFVIANEELGEVTFTYPKKMSFQVNAREKTDSLNGVLYNYQEVYNADYYFSMNMTLEKNARTYYDEVKRQNSTAQGFKEYKWNNLEGFAFTNITSVYFFIILDQDDHNNCTVLIGECTSKNPYEDKIEVFNEEELQNVLNTVTFKKPE